MNNIKKHVIGNRRKKLQQQCYYVKPTLVEFLFLSYDTPMKKNSTKLQQKYFKSM